MAELVGSYQVSSFTTPVNGTTADADIVRGNDNSVRAAHNSHDSDTGIHFQGSLLADRPVAGGAGRKWFTSDDQRVWYDDGSNWQEIAYARSVSPTFTGTVTVAAMTLTGTLTVTGAGQLLLSPTGTNGLVTSAAGKDLILQVNSGPQITLFGATGNINMSTATGDIQLIPGSGKKLAVTPSGGVAFEIRSDSKLWYNGTALINSARPVWIAPTGTLSRGTFDQSTVTLAQLAQRVAQLITDLQSTHGLLA